MRSSLSRDYQRGSAIDLSLGQDLGIRQFLLTNMDRADPSSPYRFRLPLHFLRNAIDEIGHFPYAPGEKVFEKPSLFLKGASPLLVAVRRGVSRGLADSRTRSNFAGAKSKYINSRNIPIIKQFFPNSQLETLDAGHWGARSPSLSRGFSMDLLPGTDSFRLPSARRATKGVCRAAAHVLQQGLEREGAARVSRIPHTAPPVVPTVLLRWSLSASLGCFS